MTFICAIFAWSFIAMLGTMMLSMMRDGAEKIKRLHQIPCDRCCFQGQCSVLKCTVHPLTAFTEEAIQCPDFEVLNSPVIH